MQIKVLNHKINYQIINQDWLDECRPIIIFLHEGLGSIGQWKSFPKLLSNAAQMPTLVYDRLGYGKSDYWDKSLTDDFLHKEALIYLPALIEALDLPNEYYVFGHSDGGTIALLHASARPKQLRGIIVEAPHVILEDQSIQAIRMAREMLKLPEMIKRLDRYQSGRAAKLVDEWTALWLRDDMRQWEMLSLIKKIESPMLLIQGDLDDFGSFEQLDITAQLAQSDCIQLEKLKDCGHIPHLQQQSLILHLSKEFLKKF